MDTCPANPQMRQCGYAVRQPFPSVILLGFSCQSYPAVPCYKGSFYNETSDECEACGLDTYQDSNGALSCKKCALSHGTLKTGAISMSACLPKCPAGFFKPDRPYGVCSLCPEGTYSEPGSQNCTSCEEDKSTLRTGSTSPEACIGEFLSLCLAAAEESFLCR